MRFLEFKNQHKSKAIFSLNDIRKHAPNFDRKRLVEWQKAGYIKKIRSGFYCFADLSVNEVFLFHLANQIYKPSYLSLQSAMSYYNLIPEAVFINTSVSTRKTTSFDTPLGQYQYKSIKAPLYFGYCLIKAESFTLKIAEPEKMILDYCYLIKPNSLSDFKSLRMNLDILEQIINIEKLDAYLDIYQSSVMLQRIKTFKSLMYA